MTFAFAVALCLMIGVACVQPTFNPTLSSTIGGLTLESLKQIQDDERLTTEEKREKIREAIGATNDADGDQLVNFLLNIQIN
jgi:hypothetical protein